MYNGILRKIDTVKIETWGIQLISCPGNCKALSHLDPITVTYSALIKCNHLSIEPTNH